MIKKLIIHFLTFWGPKKFLKAIFRHIIEIGGPENKEP